MKLKLYTLVETKFKNIFKVQIGKKNESTETVNCENLGEIKEIIEESEDKEQNIIIEEAIKNAYELTNKVGFENGFCRRDIGQKALNAEVK